MFMLIHGQIHEINGYNLLRMVFHVQIIHTLSKKSGFGMKDCLSSPGLGWKYFDSLRAEDDQPIYTYNDEYMRCFLRQSVKGGKFCAYNQ